MKMGTQGSLKYYENRDPGPHFSMKMGTRGPQFGESLFSYDTGMVDTAKKLSGYPRDRVDVKWARVHSGALVGKINI